MSIEADHPRKVEDLLSQAAEAKNMLERSRLIDEALYWRMHASEQSEDADDCDAWDDDKDEGQARPA